MTAKEWLVRAKKEKFAIGAFNVGNLETFRAIAKAASNKKSPIIVESSPGETKWMGARTIVDIAKDLSEEFHVPILVNLDHATTFEDCMMGIEEGYQLIHCDASKLPYQENVELTKRVTEVAHSHGLTAEGEIDHIGGSSEIHTGSAIDEANKVSLTDPQKAKQFVQETGVDILAAFVGNVHGLYLGQQKHIDIDRLKKIAEQTGIFLSLHGSSGISEVEIKEAIQCGIVKINLNTEIRKAYRTSMEEAFRNNPDEYAMYKIGGPVIAEIQRLVEHKIELFDSSGKI